MKRQRRQLLILLVLLVALGAGFLCLRQYNRQSSRSSEEQVGVAVADFPKEDIVKFSYDYEGVTYLFEKQDGTWRYAGDTSLNLNQNRITTMLSRIAPLTAQQVIENVTDMTQYGLDEPAKTIKYDTETESVILQVGDYNSVSEVYYLCKPSESKVYTVGASVVKDFNYPLEDLIEEAVEEVTEDN